MNLDDNDSSRRLSFPLLECAITDQNGSWVKSPEGLSLSEFEMNIWGSVVGTNYVIDSFGHYSIEAGVIESIDLKPVMVVSDLDGTMVGDDVATSTFRHFWKRHRAVTKSTLVYNTGRFLFLSVLGVVYLSLGAWNRL